MTVHIYPRFGDVRILAKITADGVFVEELEHNPEPWLSQTESTRVTLAVCTDPVIDEAKAQYLPSGPVEGLSDEASGSFCHDGMTGEFESCQR